MEQERHRPDVVDSVRWSVFDILETSDPTTRPPGSRYYVAPHGECDRRLWAGPFETQHAAREATRNAERRALHQIFPGPSLALSARNEAWNGVRLAVLQAAQLPPPGDGEKDYYPSTRLAALLGIVLRTARKWESESGDRRGAVAADHIEMVFAFAECFEL